MRILSSILVFLSLHSVFASVVFAESRRMPGWSAYFSAQTIRTTQQRDAMYDKLNGEIHQQAHWDHATDMAIRAYLYEYCGEQARKYMKDANIDWRWINVYQQYTYLQTQLYQSLQPTVQKVRVTMDDKDISFPIVLSHLQSDDKDILYYYWTLPQRYVDTVFFSDIEIVREWLHRYEVANEKYPITLTDLITYKYIPETVMLSNKKIIYRSYNLPDIVQYFYITPKKPRPIEPTYVLLYQAQYRTNIEYTDTLDAIRKKILTYDFSTRVSIKKTPHQYEWQGVWWKIDIPMIDN